MNLFFSLKKRLTKVEQLLLTPACTSALKRFKVEAGCKVYSVAPDEGFRRISVEQLDGFSAGVRENASYSAGKTIKFSTDAQRVDIFVKYDEQDLFDNMDVRSSSGVDVYGKTAEGSLVWLCCVHPESTAHLWAEGTIECLKEFTSYLAFLPSYASIQYVGLKVDDASKIHVLHEPQKHKVLFYGSSITQGCAASRPGLNYVNQIAQKLDCEILNYGFSSSAKGEKEIASLIAREHADVYVIEYDHNVTVDELKKTHRRLYDIVRESNPMSFMVFLSRISAGISISFHEYEERDKIIRDTIEFASNRGDDNLCYISGNTIAPSNKGALLADDRHPNDEGMGLIAEHVVNAINERLNKQCK